MQAKDLYDDYLARRHFGSLDGLRCLCIGAVLWHHSPLFDPGQEPLRLLDRGFLGVDLFFVLSGFLITTLLLREEARKGQFSIAGFYWRRALRILPVYFLIVTALSIYYIALKGETQYVPLVKFYYFFMANFLTEEIPLLAPTWSLSVEEQYYLLWPLVLLLTLHMRHIRSWLLAAAIVFCAYAQQWGMWPGPLRTENAVWALPGGAYEAILLGSFLAVLLNNRRGYMVLSRGLGGRWSALIWLGVLIVALEFLPVNLTGWPQLVVHLIMALLLGSLVVREDNALSPVLSLPPVARVGAISYGVYLYHLIGLDFTTRGLAFLGVSAGDPSWSLLVTLAYIPISIAIAEISFRTYENYFLSFKRRKPFLGLLQKP
ncbi:acyltransferase (plasmid) [Ruegeria sp. SCSIO 43209]|uniref:acyltransferase family protein n=1 Tax=Ruegeria sp. SCSIO 43209 TaxID=2793010 RepID=UPI001CA80B33|nr:acyltransferase [Ruegeria sp. SCSIO 43209]UAB91766.1 acyltransferase [Ruegeria sp. SCSIO 43209]